MLSCDNNSFSSNLKKAHNGDAFSQFLVGSSYFSGDKDVPQNFQQALFWLKSSARQGIPEAYYTLGAMYFTGAGVEKDIFNAYIMFSIAATKNVGQANKMRDIAQAQLTREEVEDAQKQVGEWLSKFK